MVKKGLIFLVLGVLVFSLVSANIELYPEKVMPSMVMLISYNAKSIIPVTRVYAEVHHEEGFDLVELHLKQGNKFNGIWENTWVVHDTLNQEWYDLKVTSVNILGLKTTAETQYLDPIQSHPPADILPGTFGSGNYTFPDSVFINGNLGIGTSTPTEKLEIVGGDMKISGSIYASDGTTIYNATTGKLEYAVMPY